MPAIFSKLPPGQASAKRAITSSWSHLCDLDPDGRSSDAEIEDLCFLTIAGGSIDCVEGEADVTTAAGRMSAAPLEGRRRGIDEPRALAARSSIAPILVLGGIRVGDAADSLEGDFWGAFLRGDFLRAGGSATGTSGPARIPPPVPDAGDAERELASPEPVGVGMEGSIRIAGTAKEDLNGTTNT